MRLCIALSLLAMLTIGFGPKVINSMDEHPLGNYEYFPLRTLVLTSPVDVSDLVGPLRQWAERDGYKFRVSSPTGEQESIVFQVWKGAVDVEGQNRLGAPGLEFWIYWDGEVADDRVLDDLAEQLRARLVPFGPVAVTSAPPGTRPRKKTELYGRH